MYSESSDQEKHFSEEEITERLNDIFEFSSELLFQGLQQFINRLLEGLCSGQFNSDLGAEYQGAYAQQIFNKKAQFFLENFRNHWIEKFKAFHDSFFATSENTLDELALLDSAQVQTMLDRKKFIGNFRDEQTSIVDWLLEGFSKLNPTLNLLESDIPFLPTGLAACLMDSLADAEFEFEFQRLIEDQLSVGFYPKVATLYWSTRKHMENHNIVASDSASNEEDQASDAIADLTPPELLSLYDGKAPPEPSTCEEPPVESNLVESNSAAHEITNTTPGFTSAIDSTTRTLQHHSGAGHLFSGEPNSGTHNAIASGLDASAIGLVSPNLNPDPQRFNPAPQALNSSPQTGGGSSSVAFHSGSNVAGSGFANCNSDASTLSPAGTGAAHPGNSTHKSVGFLEQIRAAKSHRRPTRFQISGTAAAGSKPIHVSNHEVERMLSSMDLNAHLTQDSFNRILEQKMNERAGDGAFPVMEERSEEYFDVIPLMFNFLCRDFPCISDVEQEIKKLEVAYLRMILLDDTLFDDAQHPARKLLNDLMELAASIESPKTKSFKILTSHIATLSQQRKINKQAVAIQQANLSQYMEAKVRTAVKSREAQVREAAKKKAELEALTLKAKERVKQEIKDPIARIGKKSPIHYKIEAVWSQLVFDLVKSPKKTEAELRFALNLFKKVLWSIGNGKEPVTKAKLIHQLPFLLKGITNTLADANVDMRLKKSFSAHLQRIHQSVLEAKGQLIKEPIREAQNETGPIDKAAEESDTFAETHSTQTQKNKGTSLETEDSSENKTLENTPLATHPAINIPLLEVPNQVKPSKDTQPAPAQESDPIVADPILDAEHKLALEKLLSVGTGTWMDYKIDNNFKRCKVAFYSPSTGKYTFIDQRGHKLFVKQRDELLTDIQVNLAKVLENEDTFERALESVISSIRNPDSLAA